jgi:hypothetical protein
MSDAAALLRKLEHVRDWLKFHANSKGGLLSELADVLGEPAQVSPADVVQLDPSRGDWAAGLLLVVTEVLPWGVKGFVPWSEADQASQVWLRVSHGGYQRVGALAWPAALEGK